MNAITGYKFPVPHLKAELTVERVTGSRACVLRGRIGGKEIDRVTTMDPQMMVDYLHAVYPGVIVHWVLLPKETAHSAVATGTGVAA